MITNDFELYSKDPELPIEQNQQEWQIPQRRLCLF